MKEIKTEEWTPKQLQHHRLSGSALLCVACRKKGHSTKSRNIDASSELQCADCKRCKSRAEFDQQNLKDKQKKEKAGASYTLVCSSCKPRERDLIKKLDTLHAGLCPRSCGTQLFRHSESCKARFRVRVTEEDLKFLTFRAQYEGRYALTDVAYYRRLGVLL